MWGELGRPGRPPTCGGRRAARGGGREGEVRGEMEWSCGSLLSLLGHLEGQFGHGGV